MARNVYDTETKSGILKVVAHARKVGKTWAETHKAASSLGYKGGLQSLMIFSGLKGKSGRGPGRPPKAIGRRGPGRPPKSGLGEIDQIISKEVQARINRAAKSAIRELQKLIK